MTVNLLIRIFGTALAVMLFILYVPGFYAVDPFTVGFVSLGVALFCLYVRPFVKLEMSIMSPVTIGIPVFVITFALLFILARVFPGFAVSGYWQIPLASLAVTLVHLIAESVRLRR